MSSSSSTTKLNTVELVREFFSVLVEESAKEEEGDATAGSVQQQQPFTLCLVLITTAAAATMTTSLDHIHHWTLQFDERDKLVGATEAPCPNARSTLEIHETTVAKLVSRELSPIKAYLQRLVRISGDRDAWRRLSLAALKRTGLRILPLLENQLPFPLFSNLDFVERGSKKWVANVSRCQLCGVDFHAFLRRHHCRLCEFSLFRARCNKFILTFARVLYSGGKCVCAACSPHALVGKRVCVPCFQQNVVVTELARAEEAKREEESEEKPDVPRSLENRIAARLVSSTAATLSPSRMDAAERAAALSKQVLANLDEIRDLKRQVRALALKAAQEGSATKGAESSLASWSAAVLLFAFGLFHAQTSALALYFCLSQFPRRPQTGLAAVFLLAIASPLLSLPFPAAAALYQASPIKFALATLFASLHLALRASPFSRLVDIYSTCFTIIALYQSFKLFADRFVSDEATRARWLSKLHELVAPMALHRVLELQSVFVKFGQYMGARSDIMPKEWTSLLERLQDDMPSTNLGRKSPYIARLLEEIGPQLVEFDPEPVASASIAQVHAGVWKNGEARMRVAIKIQHENCAELMRQDMIAFKRVMRFVCWLNPQFNLSLQLLVAWEKEMIKELDFTQEVANLSEIAASLLRFPRCQLPQVLYSSPRCFVMTWMDGFKITDLEQLNASGVNRTELLNTLISAYAHQVFCEGLFQADPHAGNLQVNPSTQRLILLDFGMCVRLGEAERLAYCKLVYGLGHLSVSTLSQAVRALGYANSKSVQFPEQDLEYFAFLLRDTSASREESRETNSKFMEMRRKQQEEDAERAGRRFSEFPDSLLFIMRTFGLLRGLCTSLETSTSYMENMQEFARYALVLESKKRQLTAAAATAQLPREEKELNSLERDVLAALDAGMEGGMQIACYERGTLLVDLALGTVSDCDVEEVTSSTLFPLLELTKVLEAIAVLRRVASKSGALTLDAQLLGPTIPSPRVWETLNHSSNGLENAIHPSSFGHTLLDHASLLAKVQNQAAAAVERGGVQKSARHTLSFGYELDLALKFNLHPASSLERELARFNNAELNYACKPQSQQQRFASISHGYAKDIQTMMLAAGPGAGGASNANAPLSLTNLPVLPGRIVPDAMMVNGFREDGVHVPSIGAYASARALCRFVCEAMMDLDFVKHIDQHHSREEENLTWGMGFRIHPRKSKGSPLVLSHASFGGSLLLCVPERRLCLCILVSHLQLDHGATTQRIVDLVCERAIGSVSL